MSLSSKRCTVLFLWESNISQYLCLPVTLEWLCKCENLCLFFFFFLTWGWSTVQHRCGSTVANVWLQPGVRSRCAVLCGFDWWPDSCYEAKLSHDDCQPDWVYELKSRSGRQKAKLSPDVQITDTHSTRLDLAAVWEGMHRRNDTLTRAH